MDTNVSGRSFGASMAVRCLVPLLLLLSLIPFSASGTPLGDASGAAALTWRTDTDHPWAPDTVEVPPGMEVSLRSGEIDSDQSSFLETYITGPGNIKFWWKVSSEPLYDVFQFSIDGATAATIHGETDWASREQLIGPGVHVLRWSYIKDQSSDVGQDAAWIAGADLITGEWKSDWFGPRAHTAIAYDSLRERVVEFGGDTSTLHADTWACTEETSWSLLAEAGPPARNKHRMVYDADRDRLVLFGGVDRGAKGLADTWEFDGTSWRQVFPATSPTPRHSFSMVYDPLAARTLLFGGIFRPSNSEGENLNDLWEWNGSDWAVLFPGDWQQGAWPDRDRPHAATFDTKRGVLIVYEAYYVRGDPSIDTSRIWEWDDETQWRLVTDKGPAARTQATFVYDASRDRAVLFGGYLLSNIDIHPSETWEWDGAKWSTANSPPAPKPRDDCAMVYDEGRQAVFLFGGDRGADALGDSWLLTAQGWDQLTTDTIPSGGFDGSTLAYDSSRDCLVAFGGYPTARCREYKDHQWRIADLPGQPACLHRPALAYHNLQKKIYLYGGLISKANFATDTWAYDGKSWQLLPVAGAIAANVTFMAYDQLRDVLVLLADDETWEFDGQSWSFRSASGPSPNGRTHISFDPICGECVVVKGGGGLPMTMYSWNGTRWRTVQNPDVPRLSENAAGFVPALGQIISVGGTLSLEIYGDNYVNDCDSAFRQIPNSGPLRSRMAAMTTDYEGGQALLVDGLTSDHDGNSLDRGTDVWKFTRKAQPEPSSTVVLERLLGRSASDPSLLLQDTNEDGSVDIADLLVTP